jgi:hypothetical protein
MAGSYSAASGGRQGIDYGRYGVLVYSDGIIAGQGDAQMTSTVFRGSGATAAAFRMTADGGGAGNFNCMNLIDNRAHGFSVRLHARDFTTAGTDYDWFLPQAMLSRDAGAASTVLTLGTPTVLSRGTVTGVAVTASADTTNGCLNLSFTPPTGNAHTWHAVARIEAIEVQ